MLLLSSPPGCNCSAPIYLHLTITHTIFPYEKTNRMLALHTCCCSYCDQWIGDRLDELVTQYAGKVLAIHQEGIIVVGNSKVGVYREIRRKGVESMPLVFRVSREE